MTNRYWILPIFEFTSVYCHSCQDVNFDQTRKRGRDDDEKEGNEGKVARISECALQQYIELSHAIREAKTAQDLAIKCIPHTSFYDFSLGVAFFQRIWKMEQVGQNTRSFKREYSRQLHKLARQTYSIWQKSDESSYLYFSGVLSLLGIAQDVIVKIGQDYMARFGANNPVGIQRLVSSFSQAGIQDHEILTEYARACLDKINKFSGEAISRLARDWGKLQWRDKTLFQALPRKALEKIDSMVPPDLSCLAMGLGKVNYRDDELFERIAEKAIATMHAFSISNIANLAWAFGKFRITNVSLFKAIEIESCKSITRFGDSELSQLIWWVGRIYVNAPDLFNAIQEKLTPHLRNFDLQTVEKIAWVLAISGLKKK